MNYEDITKEQLIEALAKANNPKPPKRKMKSVHKVILYVFILATAGQFMGFWLAYVLRSEVLGSILLTSSFASVITTCISFIFYKLKVNTKAMDLDYDPNYDNNNNLY